MSSLITTAEENARFFVRKLRWLPVESRDFVGGNSVLVLAFPTTPFKYLFGLQAALKQCHCMNVSLLKSPLGVSYPQALTIYTRSFNRMNRFLMPSASFPPCVANKHDFGEVTKTS